MKKYHWYAIILSLLILILSSASILYFYLHPVDKLVFLGRKYTNSQDVYTYASFIEQAKQGETIFKNLFTSEAQTPSLIRPSYLAIGYLARVVNLSSISAYHISRILLAIFFLSALWHFLGYFFTDLQSKFIAYALTITSSGLGFLVVKWFPNSSDLWIPESNTFFMLGEAPHFILSQLLMLLGYSSFLNYLKTNRVTSALGVFLSFLILSFEHPFNLIAIIPILFITAIWSGLRPPKAIMVSLLALPGLGYQWYQATMNPVLSAWQPIDSLLSPRPLLYFLGFGMVLILALHSVERILSQAKITPPQKLLLSWLTLVPILVYLPFSFERRLIEGFHLPLAILASSSLIYLTKEYFHKSWHVALSVLIFIFSLTSLYLVYTDFKTISSDNRQSYYYHVTATEMNALNWLKHNTSPSDVILSNWFFGNLIPGVIGRQVYLGHQYQTLDWDIKNKDLTYFTRNLNSSLNKEFLSTNHISYIFIGQNDIILQNGFNPLNYPMLKAVYDQDGVKIYHVIPD